MLFSFHAILNVRPRTSVYPIVVPTDMVKAAPKSRLKTARMLLGLLLGGLGRLAIAGFVRCRVVDLANVVGLDRKRLVLHAVSRVRLGLDLAFNDDQRLPLAGRLRLPSIRFVGSWLWGRSCRRGSLPRFGRRLEGRSERTRRRGRGLFKAIRKIGGTGSASGAVPLATIWAVGW